MLPTFLAKQNQVQNDAAVYTTIPKATTSGVPKKLQWGRGYS